MSLPIPNRDDASLSSNESISFLADSYVARQGEEVFWCRRQGFVMHKIAHDCRVFIYYFCASLCRHLQQHCVNISVSPANVNEVIKIREIEYVAFSSPSAATAAAAKVVKGPLQKIRERSQWVRAGELVKENKMKKNGENKIATTVRILFQRLFHSLAHCRINEVNVLWLSDKLICIMCGNEVWTDLIYFGTGIN